MPIDPMDVVTKDQINHLIYDVISHQYFTPEEARKMNISHTPPSTPSAKKRAKPGAVGGSNLSGFDAGPFIIPAIISSGFE